MGKKDPVTEEFLDKKLKRLDNRIIKKLNLIIGYFDKMAIDHENRIERLEKHLGLPYAREN